MRFHIQQTANGLISYPLHAHKHYEVMLYLEGEGVLRTEEGGIAFKPQTILVVPPGIKHGSVSEAGFRNISVEGEIDHLLCFDQIMKGADNTAMDGTRLVHLIYENRNNEGAYLNTLCEALIHFALQQIRVENPMESCVRKIVETISRHAFDAHINLNQILLDSGYSEDYARAGFKKIMKKSPTEYLTELRIRHACFLIDIYKNTLSLSEISERCGYLDYVYFSKKFKTIMGVSPKTYRDQ
jgi:AraC-like DNA-binding protein